MVLDLPLNVVRCTHAVLRSPRGADLQMNWLDTQIDRELVTHPWDTLQELRSV